MAQVIYGLVSDNGDGSASMDWFRDPDLMNAVLDRAKGTPDWLWEGYLQNEGSPNQTLTFPDDLDLTACGFRFVDDDIRGLMSE